MLGHGLSVCSHKFVQFQWLCDWLSTKRSGHTACVAKQDQFGKSLFSISGAFPRISLQCFSDFTRNVQQRGKPRKNFFPQSPSKVQPFAKPRVQPFPRPRVQPFPRQRVQSFPRQRVQPFPRPRVQPFPRQRVQPFPRPTVQPFPRPRVQSFPWPRVQSFSRPRLFGSEDQPFYRSDTKKFSTQPVSTNWQKSRPTVLLSTDQCARSNCKPSDIDITFAE